MSWNRDEAIKEWDAIIEKLAAIYQVRNRVKLISTPTYVGGKRLQYGAATVDKSWDDFEVGCENKWAYPKVENFRSAARWVEMDWIKLSELED